MSLTKKEQQERNATIAMRLMESAVRLLRSNENGYVECHTDNQVSAIAEAVMMLSPLTYPQIREAIYEKAAAESVYAAQRLTQVALRSQGRLFEKPCPNWEACAEALKKIIYG